MKNFILFYCFLFVSFTAQAIEYSDIDDVLCESFGDKDKDGIEDSVDNCPQTYNPHQDDSDRDGIGDVCDDDDCGCESEYQMIYVCQDNKTRRINCSALSDAITFCGPCESRRMDPCMTCAPDDKGKLVICHIPLNPQNLRTIKGDCDELDRYFNADGSFYYPDDQCGPCNCAMIGDIDTDGDGVCDGKDECPTNPDKKTAGMCGCDDNDTDKDWVCDSEDICPGWNDKRDADGDGVPDGCDKCPGFDDKADMDGDGIPDGCDECMMGDSDGDGVCDIDDICTGFDDKVDTDDDSIPDGCDLCPQDANNDSDGDGVCDNVDVCPGFDDKADADSDQVPDGCDVCPQDANDDSDGDGVCDSNDICPGSDDNADMDGDGIPDGCDECMMGDSDGDGVCDNIDVCPGSDDKEDTDGDQVPDGCDVCPQDANDDSDGDGVCDSNDICPGSDDNADMDGDGIPDGCDECMMGDSDGDGVCDNVDVCPGFDDKVDADGDQVPDGCDVCPQDANDDSDGDGVCDSQDCQPNNPNFPASPGANCNDGDITTENDTVNPDGCGCNGTPIVCEIELIISDIECSDNNTPADSTDDTYTFGITAMALQNAGNQWEGSFSNAYLGVYQIGPTDYGQVIALGPFPAGTFTTTNTSPPLTITAGMSIDIVVSSVGSVVTCTDSAKVDSPGTCACNDSDGDGVCDNVDVCPGFDDKADADGDQVPDGCDICPQDVNNDSDGDGVCDSNDICPGSDDNADMDGDGIPDGCDECMMGDSDGDGVCDNVDVCPGFDDKADADGDQVPDGCDVCPQDANDDSDGDGVCDSNDICPGSDDNADMDGDGIPDGCDECLMGDSDGDGVCDNVDVCPGFDDYEDADGDQVPDGCDICPQDANDDSDGDGVCDSQDCQPNNANFPATPGASCNDGDPNTENDKIDANGCGCSGTPIVCSINLIVSDIMCDDNDTPADASDDTYTFSLTAQAVQNAGTQWQGTYDNAYLGAAAIGPTNYGEKIVLGPFPAGTFTSSNTVPPVTVTDGLSINIQVNAVGGDATCQKTRTVDPPGTCACDDSDSDGVCDADDKCPGFDDAVDTDRDGIPDGCDDCSAGDVDNDGVCDDRDICLQGDDSMDMDFDGVPDACDICPLDFFDDFDGDGVCDFMDRCQGSDDKIDTDGDGVPDGCDFCPTDATNDSDGDGVCDGIDICPNGDDHKDTNSNGIPDDCEASYCDVKGQSEYEWIDNVTLDDVYISTGDDGGYGDYTAIEIETTRGDTLMIWLTAEYTDDVCELRHYAYADWNQDGDFDDEGEFLFLVRSLHETGANIKVPEGALLGKTRIRLFVTSGRLNGPCDPCFDGEAEDYTLIIKPVAEAIALQQDTKETQTKANIVIRPNPVQAGTSLRVDVNMTEVKNASVTMIDLDGNILLNQAVYSGTNHLPTTGVQPGIYILEYRGENANEQLRVVIQD